VARSLGETGFGQLAMLMTTFTTLGVFASFGLGTTATRFISLCRSTEPQRAGRIATFAPLVASLMGLLAFGIVLYFSSWLSSFALNDSKLAPLVRLAAPILILGALQDSTQGVLAGLESFRALARAATIAGSALTIGMVAGAFLGGLRGCLVGMLLGMSVGCLFSFNTMRLELRRQGIPLKPPGWLSEITTLWRFALPTLLSSSLVGPVNWLTMALLVHQPAGYSQAGIFNAANQWRNAILYIPSLVAAAGLPVLTHLWKNTSGDEYVRLLRLKMLVGFLTATAIAIPIILAAPLIMAGYGSGFSRGVAVLVVLTGAAVITATLTMIGQALVSEGRMWTGLLLNGLWAIVLLSTAYYWVPRQGALGLAWANLAAFGFHLISVSIYYVVLCRRRSQT